MVRAIGKRSLRLYSRLQMPTAPGALQLPPSHLGGIHPLHPICLPSAWIGNPLRNGCVTYKFVSQLLFFICGKRVGPNRNWNVCRNVSGLLSNLGRQCRWNMRMLLVLLVLVILVAMKGGVVVGSVAVCSSPFRPLVNPASGAPSHPGRSRSRSRPPSTSARSPIATRHPRCGC